MTFYVFLTCCTRFFEHCSGATNYCLHGTAPRYPDASKPRGNDAFCVVGNVGGKLKDAATRCVMRPVDASKCVCVCASAPDPAGGAYSAPPDSVAGFEEGMRIG